MEDYSMMTVLLVDDEEDIRNILKEHIEKLGVNILEASNGKEGLNIIKNNDVDLAIIDIMMPEMTGIDLLKLLHEIKPDLIAIMLTAHGSKEYVIDALRANAFDFIEKPFTTEMLLNRIQNGLKMRFFQKFLDSSMQEYMDGDRSSEAKSILENIQKIVSDNDKKK